MYILYHNKQSCYETDVSAVCSQIPNIIIINCICIIIIEKERFFYTLELMRQGIQICSQYVILFNQIVEYE